MKNDNELVIISLCSQICVGEGIQPLEPHEWSNIAQKLIANNKEPKDIFNFTHDEFKSVLSMSEDEIKRIRNLLSRSASLSFEIENLNQIGIKITTRASNDYPKKLKSVLGHNSPPIFYYSGDLDLLNYKSIGFVGARDVDEKDIVFTKNLVKEVVNNGLAVVSGGAKGVDLTASQEALQLGGFSIEFLSDSMLKKIKDPNIIRHIKNKKLLLLSSAKPDAPFNVGLAMQRNKYIYAQSISTIVVKASYNTGGTWNGAIDNLKHNYTTEYCWNNKDYVGNLELIKRGALPINDDFDIKTLLNTKPQIKHTQQSIFDFID